MKIGMWEKGEYHTDLLPMDLEWQSGKSYKVDQGGNYLGNLYYSSYWTATPAFTGIPATFEDRQSAIAYLATFPAIAQRA